MYGAFMDAAMAGPKNMFMEEDRNQRQQHDYGMMQHGQNYATMMSNTSYQRGVQDMKAAGLNPMLAYSQGGASTPTPGSGPSSSGGGFQPQTHSFAAGMAHSAQASLATAQKENIQADTQLKIAQAGDTSERAKTHAPNIERVQQEIKQSIAQIEKIKAETATTIHSAANIQQQTVNLREQIPQIQATTRHLDAMVTHLRALTQLEGARTDVARATTDDMRQRIRQDLPALEAEMKKLHNYVAQLQQPRQQQEASAHEGFIGSLGAILRILNPLNNFTR